MEETHSSNFSISENETKQTTTKKRSRSTEKDYNLFVGCVEWNIYGSQRKIGAVIFF